MKRKNLISSPLASSLIAILMMTYTPLASAQDSNSNSDDVGGFQIKFRSDQGAAATASTTPSATPSITPSKSVAVAAATASASAAPSASANPTATQNNASSNQKYGGYRSYTPANSSGYNGPGQGGGDPNAAPNRFQNYKNGVTRSYAPPLQPVQGEGVTPTQSADPEITPTIAPAPSVAVTALTTVPSPSASPSASPTATPITGTGGVSEMPVTKPLKKGAHVKAIKQVAAQEGMTRLGAGASRPQAAPSQDLTAAFDTSKGTQGCNDQAMLRMMQVMSKNNVNTLGLMLELTAMKIARRALGSDPKAPAKTMEQLSLANIQKISDEVNKDGKFKKTVTDFYKAYGEHGDMETALSDMTKDKNACYWVKKERLNNTKSSAMILAMSLQDQDQMGASGVTVKTDPVLKLTESDAAAVYTVEKLRAAAETADSQFKIGGKTSALATGNLLNISTRVARYLGKIEGGVDGESVASISKKIEAAQATLTKGMNAAYDKVKDLAQACFKVATKDCVNCTSDQMKKSFAFDANKHLDTDELQKKMMEMIAANQDEKVENELRLQLKSAANFDLSTMFSKGTTPPYTGTKDQFDPCWNKNKGDRQPSSGH